jgi:hypothetical protein
MVSLRQPIMKILSILSRLEKESYYSSLLVLISLIQRCKAQDIDDATTIAITVPALLVVVVFVLISICFCTYQWQTYQSRRNYLSRRYRQSIRNRNHQRIANNNPQNRFVISARPHPALTSLSSDTSLSDTPSPGLVTAGNHSVTSPTVPQAFELPVVSLPEATTLRHPQTSHHGDTPPTETRRASLSYL